MPSNDFKPFAVGGGATVVSQAIYAAAAALLANGFQAGIADPAYLNKVWRQSSIIAAAIGDFIIAQTGANVVDDGTTAAIVAGLTNSIKGVISSVSSGAGTIATTGGATVLSAVQYANSYLIISGVLTSDANIIFPAAFGKWTVINNTTGAFKVNAFCSGGGGVPIFQGSADTVFCDGANVRFIEMSAVTRTAGDSTKAASTTEFVTGAIATAVAGLQSQIDSLQSQVNAATAGAALLYQLGLSM